MRSALLCSAVLLGSSLLMGQANNGTITGTVSDPAGAVVPNAQVQIKSLDTGQTYSLGTSGTGNYAQPVPAGKYELTVAVAGFKKFVRENIEVRVANDTRQDIKLEVGQATQTVTVVDSAPLLKTESGEVSHTVTNNDLDNLPIMFLGGGNGGFGSVRNPLNLTQLLPGAEYSSGSMLRINGLPSSSEAIRVEGQDASNGLWREVTNINQGSVDAIQEVSVQTSNYAAEYGQAAGGYFNFTMKSGTNQFHGSAYDYFVNEAFNSGLPFTDAGATNSLKSGQHIRNSVRQNDYGFTIGGPFSIPKIYDGHNRTFFFFNFEQFRQTEHIGNRIYTVPTADYMNGDFRLASSSARFPNGGTTVTDLATFKPAVDSAGQTLISQGIYDPLTNKVQADGSITRSPFLNQQIPLTRMNPVFKAVAAYFPTPNLPGLINNYQVPTFTNWRHNTIPSFKIDESVSPTIKLSFYYQHTENNSPNNNGDPNPMGWVAPQADSNDTFRLNYDQTLRPTLLLHFGIGYLHTYNPSVVPATFDMNSLGLHGYYDENKFPTIGGISSFSTGGMSMGIGTALDNRLWEQKPTGNASLTWIKGNHTYKFGGELMIDGFPDYNYYRTNNFGFSSTETSDPWQDGQSLAGTGSGFGFASFFLGQVDNLTLTPPTQSKLGNHSIGLYAQDSWKVTRKLTVDYGLRWDYETYLREQYGRMQDANFYNINTKLGRPGAVVYNGYGGGRCNCDIAHNYPFNYGPRLSLAYQINSKTVFRAGTALSYGTAANNAYLSYSVSDFYQFFGNGYGIAALPDMTAPNPYPGITYPDFDNSKYPTNTVCPAAQKGFATGEGGWCYNPQSPFIYQDPNTRPTRIFQWSIGLQRELQRDIVVEANYVGNRGAYETAPNLDAQAYDSLNITNMVPLGIDLNQASDRSLMTLPLNSPLVVQRGYGEPYPGFPVTQPLYQALRPYPQWTGVPPFLGPPLGDSWYDSLQAKATKRFSHGLEGTVTYTWSKELTLGANSDTNYFTPGGPAVNDVFNRNLQKQISNLGRPQMLVISWVYTTPGFNADSVRMKMLSNVVRGWTLSGVLRYESGTLIRVPTSNNQLFTQLGRRGNPASWGGSGTDQNYVSGQPIFTSDPNCKCFNPQTTLILNPGAWGDAAFGQFGATAPYLNNYRWQRQPSESMGFGRVFSFGKESRYQLQVRAEFQNIFNRLYLSSPTSTNPTAIVNQSNGLYTAGFGYINTVGGAGARPRSGQMIARFTF